MIRIYDYYCGNIIKADSIIKKIMKQFQIDEVLIYNPTLKSKKKKPI